MNHKVLPTIIWRHKKENLKKCSLRGLESNPAFKFYSYPLIAKELNLQDYLLLDINAPPLTVEDALRPLFLIDATWRYAKKMVAFANKCGSIEKRSLPGGFKTAYPRCQEDCPDPSAGLASIEALYVAFTILGYCNEHLLDNYYWKEPFLEINKKLFNGIKDRRI